MNKKIERLITAGMITALVAVFFYQVAYGLDIKSLAKHAFYFRYHDGREDGLYRNTDFGDQCYTEDTSHFWIHLVSPEAGKTRGLNATADIADNCNDVHTPQDNQTSCVKGYVAGYDITCHIGIAKVRYRSCPY